MKYIYSLLILIFILSSCKDEFYMEGHIKTNNPSEITQKSALLRGSVAFVTVGNETKPDIIRGFALGININNLNINISDNKISGEGNFSLSAEGLLPETKYYAHAYARFFYCAGSVNSYGEPIKINNTFYGNIIEFTTKKGEILPWVILQAAGIAVQKTDIGKGYWNSVCAMCENSILGGYTDWRLPTKDELITLYNEKNTIGSFSTSGNNTNDYSYWSSTMFGVSNGSNYYYGARFNDGSIITNIGDGYYPFRGRCVRSLP